MTEREACLGSPDLRVRDADTELIGIPVPTPRTAVQLNYPGGTQRAGADRRYREASAALRATRLTSGCRQASTRRIRWKGSWVSEARKGRRRDLQRGARTALLPRATTQLPHRARSFATDRIAAVWSFGAPAQPTESVSSVINRFSPKEVPTDRWQRVEPVVKEAVTTVGFTDAELARKCMSIVGQLALWSDRIGHPIDATSLFTPEHIDRFITEGCLHLSDGTRLNYRSQLWRVGSAVVGHKLFPPRSVPLKASKLWEPYSTAEITELVSWSKGLPTESMRRDSWALLALGLGTGMQSEEIVRTVGSDVRVEDGLVVIDVLGTGGVVDRRVPVHRPWAAEVLRLAEESAERPFFMPDRDHIHRNLILGFIRRCSVDEVPRFKVQRLRITWIVGHLSAGTNLLALEQASGVRAGQLVKYLKFATPLDPARARLDLAGTS